MEDMSFIALLLFALRTIIRFFWPYRFLIAGGTAITSISEMLDATVESLSYAYGHPALLIGSLLLFIIVVSLIMHILNALYVSITFVLVVIHRTIHGILKLILDMILWPFITTIEAVEKIIRR